ncbi:CitMHS family transporter [Mesobacillus foraminis]|uniref:CitMHS family citrate-Mg2+:H+ or citrate-Ca2+:H+ symporter n=1 Tax=Mesobacillus foraminis TaxID=279826 RepID=A0A4R2BE12_9BACI|nr:citrate:proton symporter [Mesobacillus foraminis]TCN25177.1 CitMHS family citrate-Mg2+:H+ or citrate-Ca2+:H+ symporter [Mesobacillus foraminis]
MLALLGYLMVAVFMFLIMTGRLSALIALIVVPVAFAVIGGFGSELGPMLIEGINQLAPTGVMLMFAILYFGIMIDAGLFDPVVGAILKAVKGDPLKIVVGTAILALVVSLDGDGTTTYMITISAMLPLYQRLGMNPLILPAVAIMGVGVTNLTPWGGPTARAVSALSLDMSEVFVPLVPVMIGGAAWVIFAAYMFGKKERKRLGVLDIAKLPQKDRLAFRQQAAAVEVSEEKRPKLLWVNFTLTVLLLAALIMGIMPLPALFMIAFAIAILINYPNLDDQKERIKEHAGNVLAVVSLVFAAGAFTGILSGTKMVDAMANSLVALIPDALGPFLPIITAITSMPFTFFMSNDAYYFGMLPIIAEAATNYGINPVEIARASLLGQPVHLLSPLVASTYLLVGMSKVDFGDFQKFTIKWTVGTTLAMLVVALAIGVISL